MKREGNFWKQRCHIPSICRRRNTKHKEHSNCVSIVQQQPRRYQLINKKKPASYLPTCLIIGDILHHRVYNSSWWLEWNTSLKRGLMSNLIPLIVIVSFEIRGPFQVTPREDWGAALTRLWADTKGLVRSAWGASGHAEGLGKTVGSSLPFVLKCILENLATFYLLNQ